MQNLKLLFIINPISGGKEKQDWEASIREYFKERKENIEFYILTGKDDSVTIKHHIDSVKPDKLVAVGGDGTVKMLAELLSGTRLPLGIVPAGSANGLAKELDIPSDVSEALEIILNGNCRTLDAIRINDGEFCIHLADIGLNAMLVRYFEHSESRGMWGYAKAVFRVLWEKQLMQLTIDDGSKKMERKAYMVVIANAKTYGTGAIINPDGKIDDGIFEVIVVRKLHAFEIFKMLVSHKPFDPERIEVFPVKKVKMATRKKAWLQVDGEYIGKTTTVSATILPQTVYMMLPKQIQQ